MTATGNAIAVGSRSQLGSGLNICAQWSNAYDSDIPMTTQMAVQKA